MVEDPQHWKRKYSETIEVLERQQADSERAEKLLCRTIIRLTLAVGGLDTRLDPHLVHIRELLRKGVISEPLRLELDKVSDTLLRETKRDTRQPDNLKNLTGLLFPFLREVATSEEERKSLQAIERRVERSEIQDTESLFGLLKELLRHPAPPAAAGGDQDGAKSGLFSRWFNRRQEKAASERVEIEPVRDRLLTLLDMIEMPLHFRNQAEAFKRRLKADIRAEDLQVLLNEAIDFLSGVKSYMQREQQEIESFLAVLTGKLTELEQQALGVDASTVAYAQDREATGSSFHNAFESFQKHAEGTTDLLQLKSLVNERLSNLKQQLQSTREREVSRLRETQQQIGDLTGRLREVEMETAELRMKLRLAYDMAMRDTLTGLPNRKAYDDRIAQEIARWKRFRYPFTLLVWDVDHFKQINDRFGHSAGDKVLATVAQELAMPIRETDFVARYGGEEFAMILCGTGIDSALGVAEQIRIKIAECGFNSQGRPVTVTISCGLSEFMSDDTAQTLFERADGALYAAKRSGRDRCLPA